MKKLFITTTLLASLFSSLAFANNNSVGVSLIKVDADNHYFRPGPSQTNRYDAGDENISFSLDYGYNFGGLITKNLILAGNVFYDYLNNKSVDIDRDTIELNHRYGAQIEAGYKFFDSLSIFATAGLSSTNYTIEWKSLNAYNRNDNSGFDPIYGAGIAYDINDNFAVNFKYNAQEIELDAPTTVVGVGYETDIETFKIGASYKF